MRAIFALAFAAIGIGGWAQSIHETPPLTADQYRQDRLTAIQRELASFTDATAVKRRLGDWQPATAITSIDNLTFQKMNEDGVPINTLCDDATFIRRSSLILTGRLPDPARTRSFLANASPNKRLDYIDEVLESEAFQTYWSFWFQEYFQSTGLLLFGGLQAHNAYLVDAVADDKPLDQLAREMITSSGNNSEVGATNFKVRSIEGARYALDIYDNIAMRTSAKFLGVSIECISCHDGAYHLEDINLYLAEKTREEFWGMAAYFAGTRIRPIRDEEGRPSSADILTAPLAAYVAESDSGDRPIRQGGLIDPAYIFDGDRTIQNGDLLGTLAQKVTSDRQFARHWANRLWAHVFGLGIVEPLDGFDPYRLDPNKPLPDGWTHQALDIDLLEHLTDLFISGQFKIRPFLRTMLSSATYQMDSQFAPGKWQDSYAPYYTRFLARRLPAEAIYDSIVVATGVASPMVVVNRNLEFKTVYYAHELDDTTQPRGERQADISQFLNSFGRGNRYDSLRSNQGDISQALMLMNSPVIHNRLLAPSSRILDYAQRDIPVETLIESLFLDTLCREPAPEETAQLLTELATYDTDVERASTLIWLLINRVEFTFIY